MAKYRFRGALNAAVFPFLSLLKSRSVVQPQLDNNVKTNEAFYGTSESADYGVPQLLYCENVVPTAEGLQSVSYQQVVAGTDGVTDFDQVIVLRDADENNYLFSPAGGLNYIYNASTATWVSTDPIAATSAVVTRAYVNGRTFVCYAGIGIFEHDATAGTFLPVTITGLTMADINGIGASNNYLLAYDTLTVYWSSLVSPTDFVPSVTTGAGSLVPQDVKARITAVIGTAGGFIVYTAKNAVAAVYTNNIRAPFSFKEIANAGGIDGFEQVNSDQTSGVQYTWGTGGLQRVTLQSSEPLSAEADDFLSGRVWEEWDPVSKQLLVHEENAIEFNVKIAYISSRYLIVSYSVDTSTTYQYALIYDTKLRRWGKAKIDHVDCFAYPYSDIAGDFSYDDLGELSYDDLGETTYDGLGFAILGNPPSKRTVAFLQADGSIQLMLMDYNKTVVEGGVAIFGKFQLIRSLMMTLQRLDLEGVYADPVDGNSLVTVTALASLDGYNLSNAQAMRLLQRIGKLQRYAKRITGINVSVAVEGTFALSSYLLEVTAEGDR